MKYKFKVKYGFAPTEYVIVDAGAELEKAIYAKVEKIPVHLGGKIIDGRNIIVIEPDIHTYTGWNRTYVPEHPDDFKQIERDLPKEINEVLDIHHKVVSKFLTDGNTDRIGEGLALKHVEQKLLS